MLKFLSIATTLLLCGFSPHHHQASAAPAIGVRGAPVIHQISKKLAKATKRVDLIGNSHERFQVTFDDIPVFGMHEIIHQRAADGAIRFKEDPMASSLANASLDTKASVAQAEARSIATIHVSEGHDGTIEVIEDELNIYLEGKTAHLVYKVLCNKFDSNDGLISMPLVFVDAHSGSVVKELETLSSYALSDNDKITYNYDNGNSVGDSSSSILLEIHEHVQDVLDFLNDVCNMDSYDGNGARVKSYGDRDGYVNAYWNGDGFHYGNGNGVRAGPLGVRDIVAHEIGHAITDFSSDLVYHDESGALNEGASDIMGAMLDYYKDGVVTTDTWNIGEDAWLASVALRYMHKPSHDNSSKDHYSDRFTGNGDNGGVHYNSGILNHWFYLLSQGGQHHDSNFRTGTIISGIGIDDAFQIWFQAWTNYLRPNSDYAEAAVETLNACEDLGYDVDTICASIEDAWAEVGVTHYTWCPVDECGPHCGTCCSVSDCEAPAYDCGIAICGADGQCSHDYSGCSGLGLFQLDLKTDDYPAETSWVVKDDCDGGAVVLSFSTGSYTDKVTVHEHLEVLALSRYTFTVEDSAGDGICCSYGSGEYTVSYDGTEIASGGYFGSSQSHSFGFGSCWTEIFFEDFENGFDKFIDGGGDAAINENLYYGAAGGHSLRIRDDSRTSKATTATYDVSAYNHVRVHFFYLAKYMEHGEDYFLEYHAGNGWHIAGNWVKGTDFSNGEWHEESVVIDASSMTSVKLRFRCSASENNDRIFIDDVTFEGQ